MEEIEKLNKIQVSLEAERAVLGGVFLKPDSFGEIVGIVKSGDFYKMPHRLIYEAMQIVYNRGESIDPIVVIDILKKKQQFEDVGGEEIFYEIIEEVQTAANIVTHAKIVKEKSLLRKLTEAGTKIVEMSHGSYEDVETILDKAEGMIFKVSEIKESKDILNIRDMLSGEYRRLEDVLQSNGITPGVSSGFRHFDDMTGGFHKSDLVILAARPAMGKTAFALNLTLNMALKEDKSILIFSLEMSSSQLLQRFLAIEAGIALQKIRNGMLNNDDWGQMGVASAKLARAEINIADVPNVNVLEIRSIARRLKAMGKLDIIIIDYLQLIKGSGRTESRQQEISDISRSLKGIARELDIPIIALSQLSRAPEQRSDRRPMLSDLRESGAIEQDADMVMFLYRDDYYNDESEEKGITEVIIGKQRNGPVGTVKLKYFSDITKFGDYTTKIE